MMLKLPRIHYLITSMCCLNSIRWELLHNLITSMYCQNSPGFITSLPQFVVKTQCFQNSSVTSLPQSFVKTHPVSLPHYLNMMSKLPRFHYLHYLNLMSKLNAFGTPPSVMPKTLYFWLRKSVFLAHAETLYFRWFDKQMRLKMMNFKFLIWIIRRPLPPPHPSRNRHGRTCTQCVCVCVCVQPSGKQLQA